MTEGAPIVITCEHGGNRIPLAYRTLFAQHTDLLQSHRGFDFGALVMAQSLAAAFGAPLLASTVSRLLVDLNRSIGHPHLHFEPVRTLPDAALKVILARHYQPYRSQAEQLVSDAIASHGRVIHLSSHSFTPVFEGEQRNADIGLLYDPARSGEKALCARWKEAFKTLAPELSVRRNYPYAGRNDGLTAHLRKRHPPEQYIGIELELNQKLIGRTENGWAVLRELVIDSLGTILHTCNKPAVQTTSCTTTPGCIENPSANTYGAHCLKGTPT